MTEKKTKHYVDNASMLEKFWIQIQMPSLKNKVVFFRLMAISQKAWLGMRDTMMLLLKSERHPWMKRILDDILLQINQWLSLYDAMWHHDYFFSVEEMELIKSSETIWNMPEVLQNIADELESFQVIRNKMKNAMTYPVVVLIIAAIAVAILLIKVMPTIVSLFPDKSALPAITKFMLWTSEFLQTKWHIVLMIVLFIFSSYKLSYKYIPLFKRMMDRFFLRAPIIKDVVQKYNLYRFSKLLWDFHEAWVSPTVALQQISDVLDNIRYKEKVINIKSDIELWLWFTESMEESFLFDPLLVQIIWVGENTWNLWEVLTKMATFYREELNWKIEALTRLIEPLMMVFVASIVWVIVASIFLPMGDLLQTIW